MILNLQSVYQKFRVYKSGSSGPLLLLLHGGGHSALSWAVFTVGIHPSLILTPLHVFMLDVLVIFRQI